MNRMFLVIFVILLVFVLLMFVRFEFVNKYLRVFKNCIQWIDVNFKENVERIVEKKLQFYEIVLIMRIKERFDVNFGKLLFIYSIVM